MAAPVANDNTESELPVTENTNNTEAKASTTEDANVVDTGLPIAPDADDVETKSLTGHDADDMEAKSSIKLDIKNAEGEAKVANNMETVSSVQRVASNIETMLSVQQVTNNDKTEAPDNNSDVHLAVQPPSTSPACPTPNQASSPTHGAMIELGFNGVDFNKNQWPPWLSPAVDVLHKLSSNKIWWSLIQDWLSIENILKYLGGVCT